MSKESYPSIEHFAKSLDLDLAEASASVPRGPVNPLEGRRGVPTLVDHRAGNS